MRMAKACERKAIICLNNLQEFECARIIGDILKINKKAITNCCRGKSKTSGNHPITHERLHWMYKDYYQQISDECKEMLKKLYYTNCSDI